MGGDLRFVTLFGQERAKTAGLVVSGRVDQVAQEGLARGQERLRIDGAGSLSFSDECAEPGKGLIGLAVIGVDDRGDKRGQGADVCRGARARQAPLGGGTRLGGQVAGDRAEEELAVGRVALGAGLRRGQRVEVGETPSLEVGELAVVVGVQVIDRAKRRCRPGGLLSRLRPGRASRPARRGPGRP